MIAKPLFSGIRLLVLFLVFHTLTQAAFGQESYPEPQNTSERIISFHSDMRIDSTGMLYVSEKIKVYATGSEIKRGLVRTIPIFRKDIFGQRKPADFKITSILKDGKKENYKTKNNNSERSIYIGNEDIILDPGVYAYEINYQTMGQVGFFKDYDEIYWNVTGSEWAFNIDSASATLVLPNKAMPGNTACYTGPKGSKNKDCNITVNPDHSVTFKTNGALGRGEGFTIAGAFTRNVIQRPSAWEMFFNDFLKIALTFILVVGLGVYYYISWSRYGRDPKEKVVIPTFNVPNNWSPALLRYFYKKKIDDKSFAISIINMAVKKVIKITKGLGKKDDYAIERSTGLTNTLSKEEDAIYVRFLNTKKRIYINKANGSAINAAKNAHRDRLKPQLNLKDYFVAHRAHLMKAIGVTLAANIIFMIFVEKGGPLTMLFLSPFVVIGVACFIAGIKMVKESTAAGIFLIIWGAGFGGGPLFMLYKSLSHLPLLSTIFFAVSVPMLVLYIFLIKAPTEAGSTVINQIKGFKMYLETAEADRLNILNPPDLTPALFEKFLPYALALDVENAWSAKFEAILNDADYMPDWYDGERFNPRNMAAGFIQPFNSAVSDSKPDTGSSSGSSGSSSWSSGSSGGGSSGGGGGGGGGGGW